MKQASSLPSYNFLFLGRSSGVWRRTAPEDTHSILLLHLHAVKRPAPTAVERTDTCEQIQTSTAGHHQWSAERQHQHIHWTSAAKQWTYCSAASHLSSCQDPKTGLRQVTSASGLQWRVNKDSCSRARTINKGSVHTVLLKDPGDDFIHMLLQFGSVEAEGALKGKQTNSLCEGSIKHKKAFCLPVKTALKKVRGRCSYLWVCSDICRWMWENKWCSPVSIRS